MYKKHIYTKKTTKTKTKKENMLEKMSTITKMLLAVFFLINFWQRINFQITGSAENMYFVVVMRGGGEEKPSEHSD